MGNIAAPSIPTEPILRLSVEQYHDMLAAGILKSGDPVELLEGWLVQKMTKKPPHRIATRRVRVALERAAPTGWYVDSQEPIVTNDSEPEPDAAVIRGRTEDYSTSNPAASQVGLVVEVADESLLRDRQTKARIYGRAAIPIYWIVNLLQRRLEVLTRPSGPEGQQGFDGYAERAAYAETESVPLILDGVEVARIPVATLLP